MRISNANRSMLDVGCLIGVDVGTSLGVDKVVCRQGNWHRQSDSAKPCYLT